MLQRGNPDLKFGAATVGSVDWDDAVGLELVACTYDRDVLVGAVAQSIGDAISMFAAAQSAAFG